MKRLLVAFALAILVFLPVMRGYVPFPGDYLLVWYEPWKTMYSINGVPAIPHKAVLDDVFRQLYQYKTLAGEMFRMGQLPFWNPYNGSGMPLMAIMHAGFLTPVTLLFALLPDWFAWTIYIVLQPVLFAWGFLLYQKKLGIHILAAIFSTVVILFSGFMIVRYEYGEYIYVGACLPLLLSVVEEYQKNNKTRYLWLIPFLIVFMVMSGQPQMVFYVLLMFGLYILFRLQRNIRTIGIFVLLGVTGILLSFFQLIPTWELWKNSALNAATSVFIFERFLLPFKHLLEIPIPNYFGNHGTYNYWGTGDYIETASGIGIIPLLFSAFSLVHPDKKKRRIAVFMTYVSLATLILTVRSPLTSWLYRFPIPLFATGVPTRIFFLTTFALSIMAGIGFDVWMTNTKKELIRVIVIVFTGCVLIIGAITITMYVSHVSCPIRQITTCRTVAVRNTILETAAFGFASTLVMIFLKKKKRAPWILLVIVIGIQICLGIIYARKFLPFCRKERIFPETAVMQAVHDITGFNRVFGFGKASITSDIATALRIYDPEYYDPLYLRRYGEFVAYANSSDSNPLLLSRSDVDIAKDIHLTDITEKRRLRFLNLDSVMYFLYKKEEYSAPTDSIVWQDNQWAIVKNHSSVPRVYSPSSYEVIADSRAILQRLFDETFSPTTTVILEEKPPLDPSVFLSPVQTSIVSYQPNEVILNSVSGGTSILVLTDNYYQGWKAYIDTTSVPIYRANYTFRAVVVPSGHHIVRFTYQPQSFILGLYISVGVLAVVILGLLISRIYRAKPFIRH
jgi:hypothetical protein